MQHISALIDNSPMNRGMVGQEWLDDPRNIAVVIEDDVLMFEGEAEGLFQFHWLTMQSKGRKAISNTLKAIDGVFETTNAQLMFGLVPVERRDSAMMARWIGAEYISNIDTTCGECQLFILTRAMREGVKS